MSVPGMKLGPAALFALVVAGCALPVIEHPWPDSRPLGRDVATYRPEASIEGPPERPPAPSPEGDITLRQAVELALLHSPELAAFAWEIRVREAGILQAGLQPNPSLGLLLENLGAGGVETTLQLGQLVELGGKRSNRIEVASRERDVAGREYEIRRIEVLTRVSQRFIDALAAQRRVALIEEAVGLADRSAKVVAERVNAGKTPEVENIKAGIALATERIRLERAKRELDTARKGLAASWGDKTARFKSAVGDLDAIATIPAMENLARLLDQNQTLALWAAEVAQRKAAVELARSNATPDIVVGGGWKHDSENDSLLLGVSIPLPVFNRNQGAVMEALNRVSQSQEERRLAEVHLTVELGESYNALSSAYSEAKALRDTVLPGAQSAFNAVSEGYQLGRFGLLDVLDSQRTLFDVRYQYLRAATDYHKAVVDVERLIGDRLDTVK